MNASTNPSIIDDAPAGPSALRTWMMAFRVPTLATSVVPVLVGSACALAASRFDWTVATITLLSAVLLQIGVNLANDVFDFEKGADTALRLGPKRVTQAGLLTPAQVRRGMKTAFLLSLVCGLYLAYASSWFVFPAMVACVFIGMAYTGGPYPLGYHGLGDVLVMAYFGFALTCGTVFVQAGQVSAFVVLAAIPAGALATAILVVNNLRDREGDERAGKRTLSVRIGRRATLLEYGLLLGSAYATPLGIWLSGRASAWILLPVLTLPFAFVAARRTIARSGAELNRSLIETVKLLLLFGVLFAIGIAQAR